ncbi:efflux RND transporter permease subunit [Massilibacteroides sp.]|uniref:efflux RND transporter permease subunit n=1 Tax=Massilibacteroides sp. TaxID=2034766 RepID=UPI002608F97F|nr:efflux RND transporter permease subunit [Massilibacteroides sp.]MDD4516841.1 efflux RND transporter permease subunit [Massilibacteroides sp.]
MLNKIIHFSLNNRIAILVGAFLLLFGGLYVARNMEIDVFPDLNAPTVVVMTEANGMASEEVERLVTFPIETAVNGATDVRRVRSSSTTGFSVVWVEFEWGTDIYRARQIVTEKLAALGDALPENIGQPTLGPQSSIMGEVLTIGLTSDSTSLQDLRTIADWTIRPRLLSTGGVAQVTVIGGDIKEYQLLLDPGRLKHYGISLDEVLTAVRNMNRNSSGGIIYEYGNEYIIRGLLQSNEINELGKAVIAKREDYPVLLRDIAEIRIESKKPRLGVASEKAKTAVLMTVTKQPNTNTLELTKKLDASILDLQKNLPADVTISTDIFRQERFINSSIGNVQKSLYEGSLFVVIIIFLFLMNVRATFISLLTIPLALLASILSLKMMGLTINTMSLGGMAIAIGSLVDDAIIDVENVFKHIRENKLKPESERLKILDVVFEASKEVRMPILNSTLIIIACFVPLFFLSGMEGRMLIPLGIAFITALFASTLVALTVTPVLCSYLLGRSKKEKADKEVGLVVKLKQWYKRSLHWALLNQKKVLTGTGILLVSALVIFFFLGRNFLPPFNEGSFTITVNTLPGISLDESDKIGRQVENSLLTIPEIQTVGRKTGRAELDEHSFGVNVSEIEAPFLLKNRSKDELLEEVREKLAAIPGISSEVGQPISHRLDHMLSGTKANIAIKLFGADLNRLYTIGNQIKSTIGGIDGIADLNVEQQVERPNLTIKPKREIMAKYGVTLPEFAEVVGTMLSGEVVSQVYEEGKTFDLVVKVDDKYKDTAEKIKHLSIDTDKGKIPLEYIAEVTSTTGPNTISRENVQRKIVISANVAGRDLRGVVNDIQQKVDESIQLPEGYHVEYGGQFESEQAASRTLLVTSLFAILVIFLLLYHQFKNAAQSAVILLNLPLALIGGVYAVLFTSGEISIPAIIGFISLFGIATRNGILLMAHYNDLYSNGNSIDNAIRQGSLDRLNPILMTALSSALALIPLAIQGDLPGNEIQSPMAKVILGGLFTSTLLNMYIVPIIYRMMHRKEIKNESITIE